MARGSAPARGLLALGCPRTAEGRLLWRGKAPEPLKLPFATDPRLVGARFFAGHVRHSTEARLAVGGRHEEALGFRGGKRLLRAHRLRVCAHHLLVHRTSLDLYDRCFHRHAHREHGTSRYRHYGGNG